ncbi:MAG TPA: protein translocase subunit SecDF [Bacteroidales bacterium]|nr:protein translocase subunit SecDF [Bacteroidales bacterium]
MQNKGLVRILAVCLALVCAFYLSFTCVTTHYNKKAVEYANGDKMRENQYLDSVASEKVWLGYTLKECREKEINLGLDLKGGMNVTMEVSVPDILKALSGYNESPNFQKAMALAQERQKGSTDDFVTLFINAFKEVDPGAQLATVFSTYELKDKVTTTSSNEEVEKVIRNEVNDAISNSFNVLRTRIDRFGVVQPNIQRLDQAGRILIELPGIKEPERVRKLLQGTANLEFWETYDLSELLPQLMQLNSEIAKLNATTEAASESVDEQTDDVVADTETKDAVAGIDSLLQQTAPEEDNQTEALEKYKKANPLFAVLNPSVDASGRAYRGPVVGTVLYTDTAAVNQMLSSQLAKSILPRDLKLCWTVKALDEAGTVFQLVALKKVNRDGRASLEGDVITDARADFGQTSAYANVSMSMNAEGAKAWARITKENIGKSIAIVLDGYVYSFPTVQNEITGGNSQITGNFTVEEAKDLANTLKSGKMPAPAKIIQEDVVGPSLGQKAIHDGFISFIIAFCLVLLYMIFYYGLIPGIIADIALLCNVFLLLGILASFNAVLTLSGIAGIVLTMGMAVDANVLIYERIREEMAAGKLMKKAIQDGYSNAISAIIDANVTTFLTGVVLAVFGTGPIRGFAVTLMIGIVSSFLTAVFISRLLLERYAESKKAKELPFTTAITKKWFRGLNINFIGKRFWGYGISGALIIISILGLIPGALQSELNFGIDFSGGRNYIVRFAEPVNTQDVKASLDDVFKASLEDNETYSLNVITIGSENQVRISTNFGIHNDSEDFEDQIEAMIYEGCKPFLADDVTPERFLSTQVDDTIGIMQSQKVGPSIADDIKTSAVWSIIIALIIIALYIFIRFRNFSFSIGALAGLAHDTVIILGMYALLWKIMPFSMEIDQSFIAAILTIIGYSINDTVVVFDRIREYNTLYPKRDRRSKINEALNATLSRTFSTSMSTFVVLLAIFIFGGETIRGFVFALMLGVIIGTYSTLFIAVPLAYDIQEAIAKRKAKKAALKK